MTETAEMENARKILRQAAQRTYQTSPSSPPEQETAAQKTQSELRSRFYEHQKRQEEKYLAWEKQCRPRVLEIPPEGTTSPDWINQQRALRSGIEKSIQNGDVFYLLSSSPRRKENLNLGVRLTEDITYNGKVICKAGDCLDITNGFNANLSRITDDFIYLDNEGLPSDTPVRPDINIDLNKRLSRMQLDYFNKQIRPSLTTVSVRPTVEAKRAIPGERIAGRQAEAGDIVVRNPNQTLSLYSKDNFYNQYGVLSVPNTDFETYYGRPETFYQATQNISGPDGKIICRAGHYFQKVESPGRLAPHDIRDTYLHPNVISPEIFEQEFTLTDENGSITLRQRHALQEHAKKAHDVHRDILNSVDMDNVRIVHQGDLINNGAFRFAQANSDIYNGTRLICKQGDWINLSSSNTGQFPIYSTITTDELNTQWQTYDAETHRTQVQAERQNGQWTANKWENVSPYRSSHHVQGIAFTPDGNGYEIRLNVGEQNIDTAINELNPIFKDTPNIQTHINGDMITVTVPTGIGNGNMYPGECIDKINNALDASGINLDAPGTVIPLERASSGLEIHVHSDLNNIWPGAQTTKEFCDKFDIPYQTTDSKVIIQIPEDIHADDTKLKNFVTQLEEELENSYAGVARTLDEDTILHNRQIEGSRFLTYRYTRDAAGGDKMAHIEVIPEGMRSSSVADLAVRQAYIENEAKRLTENHVAGISRQAGDINPHESPSSKPGHTTTPKKLGTLRKIARTTGRVAAHGLQVGGAALDTFDMLDVYQNKNASVREKAFHTGKTALYYTPGWPLAMGIDALMAVEEGAQYNFTTADGQEKAQEILEGQGVPAGMSRRYVHDLMNTMNETLEIGGDHLLASWGFSPGFTSLHEDLQKDPQKYFESGLLKGNYFLVAESLRTGKVNIPENAMDVALDLGDAEIVTLLAQGKVNENGQERSPYTPDHIAQAFQMTRQVETQEDVGLNLLKNYSGQLTAEELDKITASALNVQTDRYGHTNLTPERLQALLDRYPKGTQMNPEIRRQILEMGQKNSANAHLGQVLTERGLTEGIEVSSSETSTAESRRAPLETGYNFDWGSTTGKDINRPEVVAAATTSVLGEKVHLSDGRHLRLIYENEEAYRNHQPTTVQMGDPSHPNGLPESARNQFGTTDNTFYYKEHPAEGLVQWDDEHGWQVTEQGASTLYNNPDYPKNPTVVNSGHSISIRHGDSLSTRGVTDVDIKTHQLENGGYSASYPSEQHVDAQGRTTTVYEVFRYDENHQPLDEVKEYPDGSFRTVQRTFVDDAGNITPAADNGIRTPTQSGWAREEQLRRMAADPENAFYGAMRTGDAEAQDYLLERDPSLLVRPLTFKQNGQDKQGIVINSVTKSLLQQPTMEGDRRMQLFQQGVEQLDNPEHVQAIGTTVSQDAFIKLSQNPEFLSTPQGQTHMKMLQDLIKKHPEQRDAILSTLPKDNPEAKKLLETLDQEEQTETPQNNGTLRRSSEQDITDGQPTDTHAQAAPAKELGAEY